MKPMLYTAAVAVATLSASVAHASVTTVPEPSVWSLLGIGAVGLLVGWRLRRKK